MRSTNLPLVDLFQRQRGQVFPRLPCPYGWARNEQCEPPRQDIAGHPDTVLERHSRDCRCHCLGSNPGQGSTVPSTDLGYDPPRDLLLGTRTCASERSAVEP